MTGLDLVPTFLTSGFSAELFACLVLDAAFSFVKAFFAGLGDTAFLDGVALAFFGVAGEAFFVPSLGVVGLDLLIPTSLNEPAAPVPFRIKLQILTYYYKLKNI